MFAVSALSVPARRRGLVAGSAPPPRAAIVISRISLVNSLPRRASSAFLRPSILGPLPMGLSVMLVVGLSILRGICGEVRVFTRGQPQSEIQRKYPKARLRALHAFRRAA